MYDCLDDLRARSVLLTAVITGDHASSLLPSVPARGLAWIHTFTMAKSRHRDHCSTHFCGLADEARLGRKEGATLFNPD
jgi:hypothetical protein